MTETERPDLPRVTKSPDYGTLLSWWDAWPEARPELLDFWARGNFVRRLRSRNPSKEPACLVRVQYLDELEAALKRLALLGIEADFAWCGTTGDPGLVVVPQDVDYEDSGGWGYLTASGDELTERRGGHEWCPALGFASLLPDTVTDWLATDAKPWVANGQIVVVPHANAGLEVQPGSEAERHFQNVSNATSIARHFAAAEALLEIELPYLEGMPLLELHRFCMDHQDSLQLLRSALQKLLRAAARPDAVTLQREFVQELKDSVAEYRLSQKTLSERKVLAAIGGTVATTLVSIARVAGAETGPVALGSIGAAIALLAYWDRILEKEGYSRSNPFYVLWRLAQGKGPKNEWRARPFLEEVRIPKGRPSTIPPYHWLSPPSPGWQIPTGFLPQGIV